MTMKINRQNYELYAADFLDGSLSPSDTAEFMAFLTENDDIANEIELIRRLEPSIESDAGKTDFSFLTKDLNTIEVSHQNFDEFCIAFYEGDLNKGSKTRLFAFIGENPDRKRIFQKYGQIKIQPDKSVVFSGKTKLKHGFVHYFDNRRLALISSFAAAASIALVLFIRNPQSNVQDQQANESAKQSTERVEQPLQSVKEIISEVETDPENSVKEVKKKFIKTTENKTMVKHVEKDNIIAAVSDSSDKDEEEFIQISYIEPVISTPGIVLDSTELFNSSRLYAFKTKGEEKPLEEIKEKTGSLLALAENLTVTDVIKSGINGINKMIESDLNFQSVTNDDGKITEFALSSESFNIKRKIRSN